MRRLKTCQAVLCAIFLYSLAACSAQNETAQPTQTKPVQTTPVQTIPIQANARPSNTQFSDVLKEYKALNQRLIRLQAPLRLANRHLCPKTERDPGFITHKLEDYPPHMRIMAQEVLGLSETGIFIRHVRRGSPAQAAQIQDGDEIIAINGKTLPTDASRARFYKALSRNAFNSVVTQITLKSANGQSYETNLRAQTACDVPASVIFSEDINGYTNGQEIFMTSALMKSVGDDINLSLVLAHEMAHIIAGHKDQVPSTKLELEADRMALILMHNAGLNVDKAIEFWRDAVHPHRDLQNKSDTHPSITARYENFRSEQSRIQKLIVNGQKLKFK